MRPFFFLAGVLACATMVGCSGSGQVSSSEHDAAADVGFADGNDVPDVTVDVVVPSLPPSLDCRFIDDGTTCVDTYSLEDRQLYVCGHLAEGDDYDSGIMRPFPPPLGSPYNCSNVAPPLLDAGIAGQLGSEWCCGPDPSVCVRATGIDDVCAGIGKNLAAFSCPQMNPVYPSGSNGGKSCLPADVAEAGLTPPVGQNETITCCPGS